MQVRHTYSNKRKSYGMSKLLHESPIKLPGETIDSSSTEKYSEKNHIVEKWLQKNENEMSKQANTRTPFADVYVNIPSNVRSNANLAVSTRKLRLGINLNMKENSSINTEQQVHSNSFVPYKKSRIRQFEDNIYQINDNKKTDFHTKKASTMDEILSSKEFSSHDDEPIVIENSQEILIDKDYLACLDVLKSEEAQRNINLDVMDVEVIEKLNHALKTLKNDITETMMKENMPLYIVNKNARLFLSPQALLTTLTAEHSTSSLNISKTRNRVLNRKDGKVCLKFKMKKAIEDKNSKQPVNTASENQLVELSSLSSIHLKNPIVNKSKVSISTDFANKGRSEGVMSETSNVFQNLQQRDVFGSKLQEEMISCMKQLYGDILRLNDNSANIVVDNECEHSDDLFTPVDTVHTDAPVIFEESSNYNAYEVSGNHVVEVQVHASHISPETTPEHSIIEGSPQNIRSSPRLSNSLSLARRRISFGYQQPPLTCNQQGFDNIEVTSLHSSGNISNNSSDKENYHPNTIRKIVDKCEKDKKHKENAAEMRLPFIVLSETDMFEKVCVSCSWLGSADMSIVKLLCKQQGWSFTPHYKPNVTHLVVPVDVENKAPRSISYVCALAAGRWIVSVQWANLCLTQECHLEEKPFEVTDECGALSPRLSRTSTRGLFTGLTFCLLPPFNSIQRDILTEVVVSAGGRAAGPGDTPEQRGLHIALCQPAEETDVDTYTDGEVGTRRVLLHYKWVVECLGRYDLISPEPFLLHPTDVDQINKVRMITNQEPFNESS